MKSDSLRFLPLILVLSVGVFASCSAPVAAVKGCDDPRPVLVHGQETGLEACTGGATHRSKIVQCPHFEPEAAQCPMDLAHLGTCSTTADCAGYPTGTVCSPPTMTDPCRCAPSCVTDADCGPGRLCRCDGLVPLCVKALCENDAACAAGRLCMLTDFISCTEGHSQGFACQSDLDECLTSLDCPDPQFCAYSGDHRTCMNVECSH